MSETCAGATPAPSLIRAAMPGPDPRCSHPGPDAAGALPEWVAGVDAVRSVLTAEDRTLAQGALAWLWARGELTVPIPGFRSVGQIEENAAAREFGPLSAAQIQEIAGLLTPVGSSSD